MTERVSYVELDLKRCTLDYGVSPCTASVGVTGERKCFNTLATCQDTDNYDPETITVRYSSVTGDPSIDIEAIPSIQNIDIRPAKLELGESIGIRASVTIQFKDHRFPDTGPDGDKYLADRDYDPYTQGTYWGKFRARQPFTRGQDIRIIRGSSDQSLEQMETRHFVVDQVAGPSSDGTFTIIAKDALKLADGDRAQAPRLSQGYLSADITDTATSLTLEPVGIGDIDYPASGKAQIGGKEVVTFTRSGDVVTLTARGLNGTEAVEHDEEDKFQLCLEYSGEKCTDIISDLLTTYASVPASYIPSATWESEDDTYIARLYTSVIAEPTAVNELINELLQQTASTLWWDDEVRSIRFRVLREVASGAALYNEDLIVAGSFSAKDQPEKRVSQVWIRYGQISPLESLDEKQNYRSTLVVADLAAESNFNGVPAIRNIYSRWIPAFARDAASRLGNLILSRYSTPPRMFAFTLQRDNDLSRPGLGGGYRLEHWSLQDDTGANAIANIQTVQVRNTDTAHAVMAEEVLYSATVAPDDPNVRPIVIDTDINNVNIRDLYDLIYAAPDGDTVVDVTIESGVIVGSQSVSSAALDTGLWPEGPTINIINQGRIQGRGGAGGKGGNVVTSSNVSGAGGSTTTGASGQTGGDALLARYDCNIDNLNGELWSGGGGGGGGGAGRAQLLAAAGASGSGGGSGAGLVSNNGGLAGDFSTTTGGSTGSGAEGQSGSSSTIASGGGEVCYVAPLDGQDLVACSGTGGNGGGPGLAGASGSSGTATGPGAAFKGTSAGGVGGQPGRAIVQSGATATITATGDIRGAIV